MIFSHSIEFKSQTQQYRQPRRVLSQGPSQKTTTGHRAPRIDHGNPGPKEHIYITAPDLWLREHGGRKCGKTVRAETPGSLLGNCLLEMAT